MISRISTQACMAILLLSVATCASPVKTETRTCEGTIVEGPWYKFLLPQGMNVDGVKDGRVESSSVWLNAEINNTPISFFLFAPQHGGNPYPIYLDSLSVHKLVDFDTDNGKTMKYIVTYEDGSVGMFEGNAQKVTGMRVAGQPLGREQLNSYHCFLDSIEQFTN